MTKLSILLAVGALLIAAGHSKIKTLRQPPLITKPNLDTENIKPERYRPYSNTFKQEKHYLEHQIGSESHQNFEEIFLSAGDGPAHDNSGRNLQQCSAHDYVCVHKSHCLNGTVVRRRRLAITQKQYCNIRTEICCRIGNSFLSNAEEQNGLGEESTTVQRQTAFNQSGSSENSNNYVSHQSKTRLTSRGKLKFHRKQTSIRSKGLEAINTLIKNFRSESLDKEIIESGQSMFTKPGYYLEGPKKSRVVSRGLFTALTKGVITGSCAASLKCTRTEYCTFEGLISETKVVLTELQQSFKVPLSDCVDLKAQFKGSCCRDPNFDPGPSDPTGQWDPERYGAKKGEWFPAHVNGKEGIWVPGYYGADDGKWHGQKYGSDGKCRGVYIDYKGKETKGEFEDNRGMWDAKKHGFARYVPATYKGDDGKWRAGVFSGDDGSYKPDDRGKHVEPKTTTTTEKPRLSPRYRRKRKPSNLQETHPRRGTIYL